MRGTTRVKMFFDINNVELAEELIQLSGQELGYLASFTAPRTINRGIDNPPPEKPSGPSTLIGRGHVHEPELDRPGGFDSQWQAQALLLTEQIIPKLTPNDVNRVTGNPHAFPLQLRRGAGYAQYAGMPILVRTTYPIPTCASRWQV